MKMPISYQIGTLLSKALFAVSPSEKMEWEEAALLAEASSQAVLLLAAQALETVSDAGKKQMNAVIARNMNLVYEHTELHELLTENGIPYVILKGCASASYYPDPILRTMGDVDFLVKPEDFDRAGELLENIGFTPEEDRGGIHVAYHRDAFTWEMHRSVNGIPSGECGKRVAEYLRNIIETAVDYETECGTMRIPDAFHHCLILLLHTASHLTSEGIGLRHLCDWAVFAGKEDVGQWQRELELCGLWRFAQILTLVSEKYLGLPGRAWSGEAEGWLLDGLMEDIFSGGNFGQKDADRPGQIKYISNRGERTVDSKSPILQIWNTIGKKAKAEQKSRIAVMAEYAEMLLKGTRKMDSRKTLSDAKQRKRLYVQLRLYETVDK